MKALQKNLQKIREEKGFSIDYVSKMTGLSTSHIWHLEHKDMNPTVETINKFCILYDCTPNYIMCDHDNPESEIFPPHRHPRAFKKEAV